MDGLLFFSVVRKIRRLNIEEELKRLGPSLEEHLYEEIMREGSLLKVLDVLALGLFAQMHDEAMEIDCFTNDSERKTKILIAAIKVIIYNSLEMMFSSSFRKEIDKEIDRIGRGGD